MPDTEVWIGLFLLTMLLYGVRWWATNKRQVKVYRVSAESLKRSRQVIITVLYLVEDNEVYPLDAKLLRYSKEDIKSACKILAYYFWKRRKHEQLTRVQNCFLSLSRFQEATSDLETQERRAARERKQLERELQFYMNHSPFTARKAE